MMLWGEVELVGGATGRSGMMVWREGWESGGGVILGRNRARWGRALKSRQLREDSEGRGDVSVCG